MVRGGPDIYRLKFRLWTNFVKRHGCLPQPNKWIPLWGKVRAQIRVEARTQVALRALKEGRTREPVKRLTSCSQTGVEEILPVPDKENIPLSETGTDPVVFKIPVSAVPRSHRKLPITVQTATENISFTENISQKENISVIENISSKDILVVENISTKEYSSKENLPVEENISCKENICNSEILVPAQTIVGRPLPGSVTVACVTACQKSSNPRQKGELRPKIPETKKSRLRSSPVNQGRKAGGKRRKVCAGGERGGELGGERGEGGGEGEILLLPCSHCRARTVLYPCTCKQVAYCGSVCQRKHWETKHQFSDFH